MNKLFLVKKGATIGLVCPAFHPRTNEEVNEFLAMLTKRGYKYKLGKTMMLKEGYLAGSDEERAQDLMDMFLDPKIDAIFCYKGGYGCSRIIDKLDFDLIKKNPKLIVGFSDITVLLNVIYQKCSFPTLHGDMGICLRHAPLNTVNNFFDLMENGFLAPLKNSEQELTIINNGCAEGILVGGNLSLIYNLLGTPYEIDMKDKILFIEEVEETPYSIDRMLCALKLAGKLKELKGVICGTFSSCTSESDQTVDELLDFYLHPLNIPVISNFECGHTNPFINLPIGLKVRLNTKEKSVTVL